MSGVFRGPVLLLHGWGGSFASTWRDTHWVAELERAGREVIELDLPGHGPSSGSLAPEDYADLAGEMNARLPEAEMFDAIGFSLGGKVLLAMAIAAPTRFHRLVITGLGANLFKPEPAGSSLAAALESGLDANTPAAIGALVDYALSAGNEPRAVAAVLRRPPNPTINPDDLARLNHPTLLICGDQDSVAMPVEPLAAALPSASSLILPGINHLELPGNPECRNAALAFLS